MKITVNRESLLRALQHAAAVVDVKLQQPALCNIKIWTPGGDVCVAATNIEASFLQTIKEVTVEREGEVLVPPGAFISILAETPDEMVSIEVKNDVVLLHSSDGESRILAQDPTDFPELEAMPAEGVVEIEAETLRYMIRRTRFAAAPDRGRYALNGVLFSLGKENVFEVVAADGSRLAVAKKKVSNPEGIEKTFIVPSAGVDHLMRLADYGDDTVRFCADEKKFMAENTAARLSCQLVEGLFPNYQDVVPAESRVKVQLPVTALLRAVRRASYVTTKDTKIANFLFTSGLLTVVSESPEIGRVEVKVGIEYDGEDASISVNPDYVLSMVSVLDREVVKMRFSDVHTPCVFKSGFDYTYVVSPVVPRDMKL